MAQEIWLAPLRGVTIRAFRAAFARPIQEAGFAGAFAPFIPANPGLRVSDRLLEDLRPFPGEGLVPQVITKDPAAMRVLLKGFKDRGFDRADLNAGCPFPMIRRRGRGSGLFKTPDVLERLLAAGCEEMGPGKFSLKIRLGLENPDELAALMPRINRYPLAVLTIHARTAKQMYEGTCDLRRFQEVAALSSNPVVYNGDLGCEWKMENGEWKMKLEDVFRDPHSPSSALHSPLSILHSSFSLMVGRGFVRSLGARDDAAELLRAYIDLSRAELSGDRPVLGRMKELLGYWCETPRWRRLWPMLKICRTVDELLMLVR